MTASKTTTPRRQRKTRGSGEANKPVYVFSFPRSGTHWLASLLKANFYGSSNLSRKDIDKHCRFLSWDGESSVCPWQHLIQGHFLDPEKADQDCMARGVYVYRNKEDVIRSLEVLDNPDLRRKFPADKVSEMYDRSTEAWLNTDALKISYEELPDLSSIQLHYNLKPDPMDPMPDPGIRVGYVK